MKQDAWINAHVNTYRFFEGVTRILTLDNLKTGVIKNTKDEAVVNKAYQEMAEHYGTAIIAAGPRKPKDKAYVEGSRWIHRLYHLQNVGRANHSIDYSRNPRMINLPLYFLFRTQVNLCAVLCCVATKLP